MALALLSHLHVFLAGDVLAPGALDSSGVAVKLAVPRLLQEEELWRNSSAISLAISAYLQLMPHLETTVSGNTAVSSPMPDSTYVSHLTRANAMSRKQQNCK